MKKLIKVKCVNCNKIFLKYIRYVIENERLGHNFYCSSTCQSEYRKTGKFLTCDNPGCINKFYRALNDISLHNFCCQSCAGIFNNTLHPKFKYPPKICKNHKCGKEFREGNNIYCSRGCAFQMKFRYTKEDILKIIKRMSKKLKRAPTRREGAGMAHATYELFGSWNNAIISAGLTPHRSHDHRMYRRIMTKANDGHVCDSISEALIDNWFTKNKIPHERNIPYPNTNHKADWGIKDNKIFIDNKLKTFL